MKKLIFTALLAALTGVAAVAQDRITVTPTTIEAGKTADVTVNLINETTFTAFQMEIALPEGFTFHYTTGRGGKITYSAALTERADDQQLTVGVDADNRVMTAAALSGTSSDFYNTNIDDEKLNGLLTFKIVADNDVTPGMYQGTVTGIKFTENVHDGANLIATTHRLDAVQFTILVRGDGSTVTLNVTSAGVATLMLPFSADVPAGLKALRCDKIEGDAIVTTQLSGIPAHTPLLITGTPGEYTFTGTPDFSQTQHIVGVLTGTYELLNAKSGYVLQKHGDEVAFYTIDAVDGENILPYRCYIAGQGGNVRMYRLADDATRIDAAKATGTANAYDLSGRRASNGRGIKITNNSKILKR